MTNLKTKDTKWNRETGGWKDGRTGSYRGLLDPGSLSIRDIFSSFPFSSAFYLCSYYIGPIWTSGYYFIIYVYTTVIYIYISSILSGCILCFSLSYFVFAYAHARLFTCASFSNPCFRHCVGFCLSLLLFICPSGVTRKNMAGVGWISRELHWIWSHFTAVLGLLTVNNSYGGLNPSPKIRPWSLPISCILLFPACHLHFSFSYSSHLQGGPKKPHNDKLIVL